MKFSEFESLAWQAWDEIPEHFKAGVDGLVVERDARAHPELPDIYTLGECATEAYPSDFGGPDTIRSVVVLYYGSFRRLSRLDPDFDWEEEVWETLTHELRHHLESLAAEDALEDVDYAADESFKRREGEPFDPEFYRSGEPEGPGRWRVEREWYVELPLPEGEWVRFEWEGRAWRVRRPERPGDVCFLDVTGGPELHGDALTLVLVRRRGWGEVLRGVLTGRRAEVTEAEAQAEPVE